MKRYDYDIVILGGGSAGIVSGVMAAGLKMRTLVIEKYRMGGECLNTGCVPSKALIHAARTVRLMRTASQFNLPTREVSRDEAAGALEWARRAVPLVQKADATEDLLRQNGAEIRRGDARFLDPHTLEVDGDRIAAEHFILATGSRPRIPAIAGLEAAGYLTNQTLFNLREVPESLLVMGGGPVGIEMAQAFRLLGSRVTVVQRSERLLMSDDAELTGILTDALREDGVEIYLNSEVTGIRCDGDWRTATVRTPEREHDMRCTAILVAVGRAPNSEGMDLEAAGVAHDERGDRVDERLRTSAPHIYACGDITGAHQFSHSAEYEAKTVVRNIAFPGFERIDYRIDPWATFTDPELAHAGMTEEQARRLGISYEVYRQPFAQNDRAITDGERSGMVKVLARGLEGKILGVHILGPRAGELMQEWLLAMKLGRSIRDVADLEHIYPTLSMACQHAAQRWYERKAQDPVAQKLIATYAGSVRPNARKIGLGAVAVSALATAAALLTRRR